MKVERQTRGRWRSQKELPLSDGNWDTGKVSAKQPYTKHKFPVGSYFSPYNKITYQLDSKENPVIILITSYHTHRITVPLLSACDRCPDTN